MHDVNDTLQTVHRLLVEACKKELEYYLKYSTVERLNGSLVSSISRLLSDNDIRATPADLDVLRDLHEQLSTARNKRPRRVDLQEVDDIDIH